MMKQDIHVKVEDPIINRKTILESAIDTIGFLKDYEKLKLIRKEKDLYRQYFKKNMKTISRLFNDLDRLLPKVKFEMERRVKKEEIPKKIKVEKIVKNEYLNKLESDISKLKAKIESL